MKRYIPLETAVVFFKANLFPKQGISSEYLMVDVTPTNCYGYCIVRDVHRDIFMPRPEKYAGVSSNQIVCPSMPVSVSSVGTPIRPAYISLGGDTITKL